MNWKYIQKLVTIFESLWERFIQNRSVYKKLHEEYKQIRLALDKECQKSDKLQVKHEHTKSNLTKARRNFSTLQAKHDEITTLLTETQHNLKKLHEKHDCTNANFNKLKEDHKRTTDILDETRDNYSTLQAKHDQTTADLSEALDRLRELDNLVSKYELISNLLNAKRSENEEFEKFKKIFNDDFMAFANKESSLADEASAVQTLQRLEKKLEEIVAFPHTFTKKSIAIGGGFSSGKSEFINSFIEHSDIKLPVGIEPVTAIPSFVVSNPEEVSIKGFSNTGATVNIELEFYRQLSRDFIDTFSFNLKDIMPYMAVEAPLKEGLFEYVYLIDSPGHNPAGGNTTGDKETATAILKDRDALIWMIGLDATGTIPQDDIEFIRDMELNGLPFYVVLNKADQKSKSELEDIRDEVKEILEEEEIEYVGISAYSATLCKEYLYDGMSLDVFLASQNQPVANQGVELKKEMEEIFGRYEKAIEKDEKTAKLLMKELNSLNLDISSEIGSNTPSLDDYQCICGESFYIPNLKRKVEDVMKEVMADYQCRGCGQNLDIQRLNANDLDPDNIDVLTEKIDNIKKSQNKDFTEIKKEMRQVKKNMLKAVDNVFLSLRPQSEVVPRSRPERRSRQKSSLRRKKSSEKPAFKNPPPPVRKTTKKA